MELLIVVVIFGIMGLIASNSLFSLLRGASKAEVVKEVKQNGDYALSVMELKIRNSLIVESVTPCDSTPRTSLTILNPDNTQTQFACVYESATSLKRLQQIDTATNYLTNSLVTVRTATTPNACETSQVSFNCTTLPSGYNTVLINFTLTQAAVSPNAAESASQTFQTQVTLRKNNK